MDEEAPLKYKFENDETRLKTDTGKSIQIFVHNNNKPLSSKYLALIKKKEVRKPLLGTFDTLVSLFLISTCVVGVWRGVWVLLEIYDDYVPAWMCLSVGLCTYIVFIIVQDSLNDIVKKKSSTTESKIFNFLITRTYTSIFAVSSIMYWRGGWAFMDKYLNVELTKSGTVLKKGSGVMLTVCAGCLLLIMALRSLRNCVAPPFLFCTDRKSKTFVILTRFRTKVSKNYK
ncbi:hypothetical protein Zmor_025308 [Zophobas morio]|uniref:Uncharacterized protein n=1 Tax=Zophobas morio TaxID=2755281 RepID=A0AA38HRV8_9CUCU|nr:hypothetical protein Zmor_025308 [Zophobas morio]